VPAQRRQLLSWQTSAAAALQQLCPISSVDLNSISIKGRTVCALQKHNRLVSLRWVHTLSVRDFAGMQAPKPRRTDGRLIQLSIVIEISHCFKNYCSPISKTNLQPAIRSSSFGLLCPDQDPL
jgi:hypothetical protein